LQPVQSAKVGIKITGTAGFDFLMQTLINKYANSTGKKPPTGL
jgi:hypothetical protein